jgi:hypothetical protein
MESLAELKLRIIQRIASMKEEEKLREVEKVISYRNEADIRASEDFIIQEPLMEYKTEQQEKEELLAYIKSPKGVAELRKSKQQAKRGELIDHETQHNETMQWLNSL